VRINMRLFPVNAMISTVSVLGSDVETDRNSVSVSATAPKLTVSAWFRLRPKCTGTNSVSTETLRRNAETAETVQLV